MKKSQYYFSFLLFALLVMSLALPCVSADLCNPAVSLINQDPYPAVPGEYVKLLFQISGVSNPECASTSVELKPSYPFSLDCNFNWFYIELIYYSNVCIFYY